jgi:hypothetical protein
MPGGIIMNVECLRLAGGICWSVEKAFTLVVNHRRKEAFRLSGLEQALWDCMQMGLSFEKQVRMLGMLGKMDCFNAEREVRAILREWKAQGLVEVNLRG